MTYLVKRAYLQAAIIIDGVTEAQLSIERVKTIKKMEWTPAGLIVHANNIHVVPHTNVKSAVLFEDQAEAVEAAREAAPKVKQAAARH